jgi:TRAP-type mannitol/chloroaromatic compound transport system substrate-binding protein
MDRRDVLKSLGAGAALATGLAACSKTDAPAGAVAAGPLQGKTLKWKMVTTWPANFPGLGTGASRLGELITALSGGRLEVKVFGAGELVPALEVFDAVQNGTAELGHGAAYYWKGKAAAAQFFGAVPFGMTANEVNGWLYYGGGNELWTELFAPFGVLPQPAGNTGVQGGGWFRKEIRSLADLKGLKMRIPGLGAEVLKRAGGTPVNLPGGEIFTALQTGAIDATEWVGPYNDLAFGLHTVAKHFHYPGWHEPGSVLECLINKGAFDALPDDLKAVVTGACRIVNNDMAAEYAARNPAALKSLVEEHGVSVKPFPPDVMAELKKHSLAVVAELAASDPLAKRIADSYAAFAASARAYTDTAELAYLNAR